MKKQLSIAFVVALGWALQVGTATAWAARVEQVRSLGTDYVAYWVDLKEDNLSLCWRDARGKALGSFTRLREHLASQSRAVTFAINAGIYGRDGTPLGLHVEESNVLRALNLGDLADGQWNFYLKPNGVFYVAGAKAAVVESSAFAKLEARPRLACQSGPLLVSQGEIHPAFRPASTNSHWRSGVGVTKEDQVVFAISKQAVRFHDFARLFKEQLGCDNALYLDGDICAIYLPELGYRVETLGQRFAGMFAVTVRTNAASAPKRRSARRRQRRGRFRR